MQPDLFDDKEVQTSKDVTPPSNSPKPFSLRLSDEEREQLKAQAGTQTLSAYIREQLFVKTCRRRKVRLPKANEEKIAAVLARLGQSGVAVNLRKLAEAAESGSLVLDEQTETVLRRSCFAILQLRSDLIKALGLIDCDNS